MIAFAQLGEGAQDALPPLVSIFDAGIRQGMGHRPGSLQVGCLSERARFSCDARWRYEALRDLRSTAASARRVLKKKSNMPRTLRIGRIFGIQLFVSWTWFVAVVLAAAALTRFVAVAMPEAGFPTRAAVSFGCAAGIFVAFAVNVVAHALVARAQGNPVRSVTLFVLGGVTDAERAPRGEGLAAVAASATSLVLAAVLVMAIAISSGPLPRSVDDTDRLGPVAFVIGFFGVANAIVFALSLLPAFPLAGGRLVRAAVRRATGDGVLATRIAAWIGQAVGVLFVLAGVAFAFLGRGASAASVALCVTLAGWLMASSGANGYAVATS